MHHFTWSTTAGVLKHTGSRGQGDERVRIARREFARSCVARHDTTCSLEVFARGGLRGKSCLTPALSLSFLIGMWQTIWVTCRQSTPSGGATARVPRASCAKHRPAPHTCPCRRPCPAHTSEAIAIASPTNYGSSRDVRSRLSGLSFRTAAAFSMAAATRSVQLLASGAWSSCCPANSLLPDGCHPQSMSPTGIHLEAAGVIHTPSLLF